MSAPGPLLSQSRQRALDDMARRHMTESRVPGLAIAIAENGEVVYSATFGHADLEMGARVTPETLFRIASVMKPMTALAVMILAAEGAIDLDDPIQSTCPAYPAKRWPVTARDLIGHTAGVRPSDFADIFNRQHYSSVAEALGRFADDSLVAEPGTRVVYSNAGYTLLACAIEGATGGSYDEYMRATVFSPAGLTRTRRDNPFEVIPGRARPYMVRTEENTAEWEGLWQPRHLDDTATGEPFNADPVDPTWSPGAGGYLTTPVELVRFASVVITGRLGPAGYDRQILQPHQLSDGQSVPRSHGWFLGEFGGDAVVHVMGSDWNGSSALWVLPSRRFAIAVSSNKGFEQPGQLIEVLAEAWLLEGEAR